MINYRMYTFLDLCKTMNYHTTAQNLNMTQPAVSQHIKYLEEEYSTKLFSYNNKKLTKNKSAYLLETYAYSMIKNEEDMKLKLSQKTKKISIGATKTIGNYLVWEFVRNFCLEEGYQFNFIVDNTKALLEMLDDNKLDFAFVEGVFDKSKYAYQKLKDEELLGVCSHDSPLASKNVDIDYLINKENIILRESGSGTRKIFTDFLESKGYNYKMFSKVYEISSFNQIKDLVSKNIGVSFVYESVVKRDLTVSKFRIKDNSITREFNVVYLKNLFVDTNTIKKIVTLIDKKINIV